jgi:hypothetical protein
MSMTSKDYIGVSLRVWHREKSPKEISAALGRDPSYAATLGSPRGHPHRAVTAATWQEHYWCSDFDEGATLEERIAAVAKFIQRKRLAMTELMRAGKGGRADLYVFAAPSTALGIELEPVLLADLGQIGINLSVEFMPPSSSGTQG